MGTQTSCSPNMGVEVSQRAAYMAADTQYITNKFYHVKVLAPKHKLIIAQTYMLTRGTFQCCTWDPLSDTVFSKFHRSILNVYRAATNNRFNPNDVDAKLKSDIDIIMEHGLVAPICLLHNSRLQLLLRIIKKCPTALLELLKYASPLQIGWVSAVKDAFLWLSTSPDYPHASYSFDQWLSLFRDNPKSHSKKIKKFAHTPFANLAIGTIKAVGHSIPSAAECLFSCPSCAYVTFDKHSLASHKAAKHNIHNYLRDYVNLVSCPICLKHFHNREVTINHYKRSKICHDNLISLGKSNTPAQTEALDIAERARNVKLYRQCKNRHKRDFPVIQSFGPFMEFNVPPSRPSNHHPLGVGHKYAPIVYGGIPCPVD